MIIVSLSGVWRNFGAAFCGEKSVFYGNFFRRANSFGIECAFRRTLYYAVAFRFEEIFARFDVGKGLRKRSAFAFYAAEACGVVAYGDYAR